MVRLCSVTQKSSTNANTPFPARQTRGHGYAHYSDDSLPLLYRLDAADGSRSAH